MHTSYILSPSAQIRRDAKETEMGKESKALRIVVPVTAKEQASIRAALKPRFGRAQAIAAWARSLMLSEAERITKPAK